MWHPFDIQKDELFVDEALKDSAIPPTCSIVYSERITRWFQDKSDQHNQWPPTVDRKPGIRVTRRIEEDLMKLDIVHEWELVISHLLSAKMECSANGWRSPKSWTAQETFTNVRGGRDFLPKIEESGHWRGGMLKQVSKGREQTITRARGAKSLSSFYSLLANFPSEEEIPSLGTTTLLEEGFMVTPDVTMLPCPKNLQQHPMAKNLVGYTLRGRGNFPADFWFNKHGLVVYVCLGPHRAFVLESLETHPS
jgi:hypothetical protein